MKQIILLICILFLVTSCEIEYDGETKIAVTGKIIDENGNPLSEKDIEVTVDGGGSLLSPSSDLISYGKSDQNGNFTLIFPAPKNGNQIFISINDIINQFSEFQRKIYIAKEKKIENYKLDLNKITLYKNESITTLRLVLNNTTPNKQIKDIKIEGKRADFQIDLSDIPNNSNYLETFYGIIKNQNIILRYTVVDYSNSPIISTEQTVSVPINDGPATYTITY
ncbi:MAG: Ig-like domain-containing protein [Flavobacteriaceae bacterium]|nr:Ig-like domain-containing protein [Flavobacteriaceae bacterium]